MKYVSSKFNKVLFDKNELILINTLYGEKIKFVDKLQVNRVMKLLSQESITEDKKDKLIEFLIKDKFIVKNSDDEDCYAEMMKRDYVLNDRLFITIMPTEQCNFRCKYCYENFKRGKMSKEVQDAIINYIARNISRYTSVDISWFGGEPLLAKDVIEYISEKVLEICRKNKRYLTTTITTNGYHLDLETFKILQKYNLVNAQITIDGLESTHDSQRMLADGTPTFNKVINNLLSIKENTKSAVQKIIIRTNVSKEIYDKFEEYIDFYYDKFGDDDRFTYLIRPVGDWGGESVKQMSNSILGYDSFKLVYDKLINYPKKLNMSMLEQYFYPGGSICSIAARRNAFIVRSNGDISKCTCDLEAEVNHIGKILPSGQLELDKYKLAKWVVGNKMKKCSNCNFYGSCYAVNCPLKSEVTNSMHVCIYEKQYMDESLLLLNSCGIIEAYEEVGNE